MFRTPHTQTEGYARAWAARTARIEAALILTVADFLKNRDEGLGTTPERIGTTAEHTDAERKESVRLIIEMIRQFDKDHGHV